VRHDHDGIESFARDLEWSWFRSRTGMSAVSERVVAFASVLALSCALLLLISFRDISTLLAGRQVNGD